MTTEGTLRHFPHDEPTDELQFPPIRNVDGKYDDVTVSISATVEEGVLIVVEPNVAVSPATAREAAVVICAGATFVESEDAL